MITDLSCSQLQLSTATTDSFWVAACSSGKHPEGYEPLPDRPTPGAWAVDIKKKQEELEAEAEKALMDTYNALNKVQDSIVPVWPLLNIHTRLVFLCMTLGLCTDAA